MGKGVGGGGEGGQKGAGVLRTQEPGHVETGLHLHPADAVGEDGFGVRVHDAVDAGVLLQDLAVDAPFLVPRRGVFVHGGGVFDAVFEYVGGGGDEGGGDVVREEERVGVVGVAQGDVAVGVDDAVVVEDVVCCYEIFEG